MSKTPELQIVSKAGMSMRLKLGIALGVLAVPVAAIVVVAVLISGSKATLTTSNSALATLKLPLGGASVTSVAATVGREQHDLPVKLIGDQVWPDGQVATNQPVTVIATIKRPGWNSWFAGSRQQVSLKLTTPSATLRSSYVTVKKGQAMTVHLSEVVDMAGYSATSATPAVQSLSQPADSLTVTPKTTAGTMYVALAPRTWETPETKAVSWFPAGSAATAVASPSPGTSIGPNSDITLTFSKPVSEALNGSLPAVTPSGSGSWQRLNSHTIKFVPNGYGYGLGAKVEVALPAGINLVGGTGDPVGTWSVPAGTTARLQQLLAELGYLPLTFSNTSVADTVSAQEQAAVDPPSGSFSWTYSNTPSALKALWQAGVYGELTKGAVMAFENTEGLTADGIDGPEVWKALIQAAVKGQKNTFGYTFVNVLEADSGENESTWHDGKTVVSGPVNTGIAAAPTQTGTFAVFEHIPVTTMSGTNPNGTPYHDPGIQWVSYFNGGDALHEFPRASYGFPQSLGCVEMPLSEAASVYPYTPIGTIVNVHT
jgi:peptidoglycan hydrolase-like protein with peptidoglycan-binding domain